MPEGRLGIPRGLFCIILTVSTAVPYSAHYNSLMPSPSDHTSTSDFGHLMWLYERNYQLAKNLLGAIATETLEAEIQSKQDQLPLAISLIDRQAHTETWHLTYWFHDGKEDVADPDIELRLYHDTKQAECWRVGQHNHLDLLKAFNTDATDALERKWQRNMMLHKWLQYLLHL